MGEMPLGSCRPTVDRDANLVEALRRHEAGAAEALIAATSGITRARWTRVRRSQRD